MSGIVETCLVFGVAMLVASICWKDARSIEVCLYCFLFPTHYHVLNCIRHLREKAK